MNNFIPGLFVKHSEYVKKEIYGIIYLSINLKNKKIYIGQTKNSLKDRMLQHIRCKDRRKFSYALRKYKNNFLWIILDVAFSKNELDEKEIKYIKFYDTYNSGYNMTEGGDGVVGRTNSDYTKNKRKESVKRYNRDKFYIDYDVKNILNYMENNDCTFGDCAKFFNIKSKKLIYFFDQNFPELSIRYKNRSEILRHKRKSVGSKGKKYLNRRKIIQIDRVIELLNEGHSFPKIAKELNYRDTGVIKQRIKEYDIDFYNECVTNIIRNRNIDNNRKKQEKGKNAKI